MPLMNKIKSGADLTKPTLTISWLVGGIVSVIMLLLAVSIGMMLFGKGSSAVGSKSSEDSIIGKVAAYGSGYD